MSDDLIPTPVTDKNGKKTTVHKRAGTDAAKAVERVGSVSAAPPVTETFDRDELLEEANREIAELDSLIADLDSQQAEITKKRGTLYDKKDNLIELKMELSPLTPDATLEEIQEVNMLAVRHSAAQKAEETWMKSIHPKLRTDTYDMEHHVPIATVSFQYAEAVTPELVDALMKVVRVTADGREEVEVGLITGDPDGNYYGITVDSESGKAIITSGGSGHYWRFGNDYRPLKETLEWVTQHLPLTYPSNERSSIYPDYND